MLSDALNFIIVAASIIVVGILGFVAAFSFIGFLIGLGIKCALYALGV